MNPARRKPTARAVPSPPAPLPRPLVAAVALLAALVVGASVTFRMDDADIWQHLAVGRAIWSLHAVPHVDLWTWPGYGQPYFLPSWLFRAQLWPVWHFGGDVGLTAWRWVVTLGTFGLLWLAARRGGARGLAPLLVFVWCAMVLRRRTMVRPEMLAGVLLALQFWLLERRRSGDPKSERWLVPVAWLWANAHISYTLFFEVGLAYLADAWLRRREGGAPGRLAVVLALALAACFANPFGFRALWEPFDFVLHQRNEPIFRAVQELWGIPWADNLRDGLPALMLLAPLLALARWRRRGPDLAQAVVYAMFYAQALGSARFLGPFAIAIAPFLARDLAEALAADAWPAWTRPPAVRAARAAAACVLVAVPELARPTTTFGVGFVRGRYPVHACDWIEREGVRGRLWNSFDDAGYLLWRFWPQRDRLPFMDIHQTGSRQDRDLMAFFYLDPRAWARLDAEWRYDWAILPRAEGANEHRVEWLAADTSFVPAFLDDDWVVWLRRDGAMADLAAREGYRWLPASFRAMGPLGERAVADTAVRRAMRSELERSIRESPRSGHAHSLLANLDLLDGDWAAALHELQAAREVNPGLPGLAEREATARDSLAESAGSRRSGTGEDRAPARAGAR